MTDQQHPQQPEQPVKEDQTTQPAQSPLIDNNLASALKPAGAEPSAQAGAPAEGAPGTKKKKTAGELGPKEFCWGTGRRKSSIARVRLRPGSGKIMVNNKEMENFFVRAQDRNDVVAPLKATESGEKYDIFIKVNGGGITGQAGAVKLGLARALVTADPETFPSLRDSGMLTRDGRMKERKKYGRKKARKSFQFSKR